MRASILSMIVIVFTAALCPLSLAQQEGAATPPPSDTSWPKQFSSDGYSITVYQPQVDSWQGNQLQARAAVSFTSQSSPRPVYGVVWLTARTEVDKEARTVTVENVSITKGNFPITDGADFVGILRKLVPVGLVSVSLDRLQANLAVTQAQSQPRKVVLKNDPPKMIYTKIPSVLVLVDGPPALRETGQQNLQRVINTRSLIVLDTTTGKYYLRALNQWFVASKIDGEWQATAEWPNGLDMIKDALSANGVVNLMDNPAPDIKAVLDDGGLPKIIVSTVPAELIETTGEPNMQPIENTQLLYVTNSPDEIILDPSTQFFYVLTSGRWFRSKSLQQGPWEFVAANNLPADFARIPENHPKGDVLAAVAGTPQAKEAVIANSIPQTATIKKSEAKFEPKFDGQPQFKPIEGTKLSYAINTPTPIIQVTPTSYYGCENGVWFTANSPQGPWTAATSVPDSIYDIPTSSPINYVTNVQVYGSNGDEIYTGYTPGYFGTYYDPVGTVVYGTGYYYPAWTGSVWYGTPWTYGFGANVGWGLGGWGLNFGVGAGWPWWGPVGWHAGWGGNWWNRGWENGWGGRYNNIHGNNFNFNNTNIYNRWGNNVHLNNFRNQQINNNLKNVNNNIANRERGLNNNVFAGHDGNVYRRNDGNWEQRNNLNNNWNRLNENNFAGNRNEFNNFNNRMNQEFNARQAGEFNHNNFQRAGGYGGYGGFRGNPGGYRGGAGAFHGGGRRR